ncbi:hypothetical protein CJ030_MR0G023002 [Morella rubra]|nr:hypothetical protein CJ030_MR0G023002 [Morella rubra]
MNPENGQPELKSPPVDYCDIESLFTKKFPSNKDDDLAPISQIPFQMFAYKLAEKDKTCMSIKDKSGDLENDVSSCCRDDDVSVVEDQSVPASDNGSVCFDEMSICSEVTVKKIVTRKKFAEPNMRKGPGTPKAQTPRRSPAQSPLRKSSQSLKMNRGSKSQLVMSPVHASTGNRSGSDSDIS